MPSLIAENGPLAGQRLEVETELTIGRLDGDVVVDDVKLSRRHAVFRVVDEALEVEDLGSTNGTFVEDRRIDRPTRLKNGARVRLGASSFVTEIEPAIQATQVGELPEAGQTVLDGAPPGPGPTVLRSATAGSPAPPAPPARAAPRAPAAWPEPAPPTRPEPPARAAQSPAPHAPAALAAFAPPAVRRGGLATRSWVPVALSYGSVIVVAIALVVYFASR